ncbi:MAG TPA: PH domain-containing protein [Gillisia sp.]|nr:PH domain-containing protein [Gillisia sp.]
MASVMENFSNHSIDLSSLPKYEEVSFQNISKNYLLKSFLQTGIFMLFVFAGWGAMFYYNINPYTLWLALTAILLYFLFRFWNTFKLQQNYGYALREKDILYRRGFFVNSTTVVPFNRIQHVSISRDVFDKFLNIASIQVFTAGGSGSDLSIPGLEPMRARELKEALAVKITNNDN